MGVYRDTAQMYEVLGGLWKQLLDHPEYGPEYREANLVVKFNLTDPPGVLWVTPERVITGDADLKPDVEMTLAGDVAHQFWLKQITLPVALARKLITAKGALNKVMKMLPLLKPLHEAYPDLCARYGLPR